MRRHSMVFAALLGSIIGGTADQPGSPAAAATLSTVIDDVTMPVAGGTLTIKRMEVTGGGNAGAAIANLLDRSNPRSAVEQLRGLTSPSVVIPEILFEAPLGGSVKLRLQFRDVRFVDIVAGRIGSVSVARTTVSIRGGSVSDKGEIGSMTARGVDLVQAARVLTEPRPAKGEALVSFLDDLAIDGIDVPVADNLRISIAEVRARRVLGRALSVPLLDLARQQDTKVALSYREQEKAMILLIEDMVASLGITGLEARDVRLSNPHLDQEINIVRIALRDVLDFKIGEVSAEGFTSLVDTAQSTSTPKKTRPSPQSRFTLASIAGVDMRPGVDALNAMLKSDLPPREGSMIRTLFPNFQRVFLLDLKVDLGVFQYPYVPMQARVERLEVEATNVVHGLPTALLLDVKGAETDLPTLQTFGLDTPVRKLNLERLSVPQGHLNIGWNEATRELALTSMVIDAAELGTLSAMAVLGSASADLFSVNPLVEEAAVLTTVLKSIEIRFVDAGLVERSGNAMAAEQHRTVPEWRSRVVQEAAVEVPSELGGGRAAKAIGTALATFVAEPKNLRITAKAPDGLGFSDVINARGPAAILDRLEVTAGANE